MLLAYVDESGNKNYFLIAALIATPEQVKWLSEKLDELVGALASKYGNFETHEELHGHEIFHGKGVWNSLFPRQQVKVFVEVFQLISDSGVKIVIRGLDIPAQKRTYANPYPPYTVVLTKVLEKVQREAKSSEELALVICDEYHEDDRHRKLLSDYRTLWTPTSRGVKLDRIIDTIHFTPSHASRMIQATDMVAFIRLRRSLSGKRDPREQAVLDRLWATIKSNVIVDYIWVP